MESHLFFHSPLSAYNYQLEHNDYSISYGTCIFIVFHQDSVKKINNLVSCRCWFCFQLTEHCLIFFTLLIIEITLYLLLGLRVF